MLPADVLQHARRPRGARPGRRRFGEMEYQVRHWNLFCWLSGDHLVEQACHEIDVANWVMDDHPLRAQGMGGRQVRTGPGTGDIFDHHAVEFEYRDGVRHFCQARQQAGTWSHVSDNVHGTQGTLCIGVGAWAWARPPVPASFAPRAFAATTRISRNTTICSPASAAAGPHRFEGDYAAASSMTAVMGRMATYSGQMITWEEAVRSTLALAPARYALDAAPPTAANAAGLYPVALPGVSKAF